MERNALLIASVTALAGIGLLQLYMQRFEQEATGGPKTRVLVVTKDRAAGATLTRELLAERALPAAYLESRHVTARDIDEVIGSKLAVATRAGETLLFTDLASMREPARQLSALVPEGMRAFTLRAQSGGFDALLSPGDRVDVLVVPTTQARAATDTDRMGSLVVQNILVLAVGDDLGGSERVPGQRTRHADDVTLSLTPLESMQVAQAERAGSLRLILRNPDDLATTELAPVTNAGSRE